MMGRAAAFEARLGWTNTPGGVDVSWASPSLTPAAPFVHYEFQVQYSGNLTAWENAALIPGGFLSSASVSRSFRLPATNAQGFVRLSYRLNMPGANLSGLDLSGADLRGANLAGANLSGTRLDGALLGGADLTGANLTGSTLAGANLQDVDLTGFDLSGLDLSTILGMPVLTQVTANPFGKAADLVPRLPYNAGTRDFVAGDSEVPGIVSTRNAMVMLKTNATVGQLNALLAAHGASIVGSSPADATLRHAVLVARFSTTSAQELHDLTVALTSDPIVEAAAPDVLLGLTEIPDDRGAASTWRWDQAGVVAGGNWGLEKARVPQMWNLVSALHLKGVAHVPTCILDVEFLPHADLSFVSQLGPSGPGTNDHGIHVAGIAGADYDNGLGIDGVNPLASLIGYTLQTVSSDFPVSGALLATFEPGRQANGYRMVQDVRDVLNAAPHTRIINMSLGFNWYQSTNAARPTYTSPFSATALTRIGVVAQNYGRLFADVAASAGSVLIVCAAGNDYRLVPASHASPMANAALERGAPNIIVVEAHDINGAHTDFSNLGGHVAAPGEGILSAAGTNGAGYATKRGTSMAAPFVTGVAGFLLAVDSDLKPTTLISLLQKNGPNVDAFTSLMEIDQLPGRNGEVLKLLLDVDDGSPDGSLRVLVPDATVGRDRAFEPVRGADFNDINHVVGNGVIDMADFRRWRDWLLYGLGTEDLNGSVNHLKHDGNGDFILNRFRELNYYPRGDFNGDGKLDKDAVRLVPGHSEALTDLEVLVFSDLWEDPAYEDPFSLFELADSVDFNVSAKNFFFKHTDIDAGPSVSVHYADTRRPVDAGGAFEFTREKATNIFTVKTGARYYVASEPIPIGDGTNVMMRSIGEKAVLDSQRGADYAVDLALCEMTTVAETFNPAVRTIVSDPNTNRADAYVGTDAGATNPPTVGARGWANDAATLYAIANAGNLPAPPTNINEVTTLASAVRWERSFIKESQPDSRFLLNPMILRLSGSAPGTDELRAFLEVVVEMRAYDISPAWAPVFIYHAEIAGNQGVNGNPSTFRIEFQEGNLPPATLEKDGNFGAEYRQRMRKGTINLDGIPSGHSFELRYRLNTRVISPEDEGEGLARIGDPLEYGSGIRMEYAGFGDLPRIKNVAPSAPAAAAETLQAASQAAVMVDYLSKTNFYYRLYRGADADTTTLPFAMKLGIDGDDSMIDPTPLLPNPTPEDYTLENQPLDQPLDFDADGIDDVYELRRPSILDPLITTDAFLDPDGDGRSNLEEYLDGTDPQTPDSPPTNATLNFPGLLVPSYPGGTLIDLNNDGLLDSANGGLNVALAHPGGTFATTITSPMPGLRSFAADTAYLKLDGDAFPDAVVVDLLTNRLFAFRGVGDGTFTPLPNHAAISNPSRIAVCNVNGDALMDVAVFSENSRGVDLHLNQGDGTLTRTATITTNAYGSGNCFVMADLNNDSRDDIIVGYAFNAVVFLSTNGGAYGPAQPYLVGSFPEAIAVGDLNHDGRLDLVVANSSSDDISVLIASAPGVFLPQVRYPVGDNPRGVRLANLDSDTHLDVVISLASKNYQIILPGVGNGSLAAPYTVPSGDFLIDILDWNNDGRLDLISSGGEGSLVNFGNGDGTFDTRLQIVPTNNPPTEVEAIDLNGDGKLELVGLQTQLNSVDVWEHAAVTGTNRLLGSFAVGPWVTAYASGDFNGDGRIDLAVTTRTNSFNPRGSNQVVVLTNAGNFAFQDAGHYSLAAQPVLLVSGDFNGDGALDLAVHTSGGAAASASQLLSLRGNGAGGFQPGTPVVVGNQVTFMAPANADNDSRAELLLRGARIVGSSLVSFLEVFAADATGGWTNRQTLVVTNFVGAMQILPANGDAYPDFVVTQTDSLTGEKSLRIFPGGPAGFGAEQILANEIEFTAFSQLADLNGDGLFDVTAGSTLYLAKPGGGFHPGQDVYLGTGGIRAVADFNRDGKPDLLNGLSILLQK
jgi:uncharacterized protein YjbI with pentapeptide repeats